MDRFKRKVGTIMDSHASYPFFSLATLLHTGSIPYGWIGRARKLLYDRGHLSIAKLPCAVISVGNITVGGTGKTPMTVYLAQLLGELGRKVLILSRGYKGAGEKKGAVVSDGVRILCDVHQAGDEPYLMANLLPEVPVVVGRNRAVLGAVAVETFDPDVILLDDGYQHRRLARDLNILLLDAQAPFGNSFLFPRGNLREPIAAVSRADVVVFTRCNGAEPNHFDRIKSIMGSKPIFCAEHRSVMRGMVPAGQASGNSSQFPLRLGSPPVLTDRKVAAFSGLAHNRLFWDTIPALGGRLTATLGFEDHHPYEQDDLKHVVHKAQAAHCDCLVTTEKDFVRLPAKVVLPMDLFVVGIDIEIAGEKERWRQYLADRLDRIVDKFSR